MSSESSAAEVDTKRLYVKWDVTQEQLKDQFSRYGTVSDVRIFPANRVRPFAFIGFESEAAADAASKAHKGKTINTQPIEVQKATGKKDRKKARAAGEDVAEEPSAEEAEENKKRLYVKWLVTSEQLKELFGSHGQVVESRVIPSPKLSPYAFVTFETEAAATNALNGTNNKPITTQPLVIEYSSAKKDRKPRTGGGSSRSGGSRSGSRGGRGGRSGGRPPRKENGEKEVAASASSSSPAPAKEAAAPKKEKVAEKKENGKGKK